ncbi:MAG: fumarylacetoacetate hydrolase family protein [Chloroflexi bacterium]|nr:fumarylacetoacetate hydrolase family protein [Chloroflexota bacterium]
MSDDRLASAARRLCQQRDRLEPFDGFPADETPVDEAQAYAIQDMLHACLSARGWGPLVGYKIGCTTPVMQAFLGIPNPCAGGIFAGSVRHGEGEFEHDRFVRVGVECEVAVILGTDLPAEAAPFDRSRAAAAVAACAAAIEVVDDRYRDYRALTTPTLIADDFFGAGCVLGTPVAGFDPFALARTCAHMVIDGQTVGSGVGSDILGEPLDALVWLAESLARRGAGLQREQVVLLGSLVQTHWVERGADVWITNDALGEVRAHFK